MRKNQFLKVVNIDGFVPIEDRDSEFFDICSSDKYDTLKCVTYIASPDIISKYFNKFEYVDIILGIDDSSECEAITQGIIDIISNVKGIDFFNGLNNDIKDKISTDTFNIRYAVPGISIHDKIYLLKNSKTGECCVMQGSANASITALIEKNKQHNTLFISHKSDSFSLMETIFDRIRKDTIDFIPEQCKKTWKDESRILDNNERKKVSVDYLDNNRDHIKISSEDYRKLKKLDKSGYIKAEKAMKVIKNLFDTNSSGTRELKQKNEIEIKKDVFSFDGDITEEKKNKSLRPELFYDAESNGLFFNKPDFSSAGLTNFGKQLEPEQIKEQIENIHGFCEVYRDMITSSREEEARENAKRAFEVILYGFISPFIWMVRKGYIEEKSLPLSFCCNVPNILILNGKGSTGKSTALNALQKLLQDASYETLKWGFLSNSAKAKGVLKKITDENNIFPVLIDEVEQDFTGRSGNCKWKGEAWIKDMSNGLNKDEHPFIIAASNQRELKLSSPLKRRVKYISFDTTLKMGSDEKTSIFIDKMNSSLFEDFCLRCLDKIRIKNHLYNRPETEINDFINMAREIFKEYYQLIGMDIPDYFPQYPFDDYAYKGKMMWKAQFTFEDTIKACSYDEVNDILTISRERMSQKLYSPKMKNMEFYFNDELIVGGDDGSGDTFNVNGKEFFKWIGIENPYLEQNKDKRRIEELEREIELRKNNSELQAADALQSLRNEMNLLYLKEENSNKDKALNESEQALTESKQEREALLKKIEQIESEKEYFKEQAERPSTFWERLFGKKKVG